MPSILADKLKKTHFCAFISSETHFLSTHVGLYAGFGDELRHRCVSADLDGPTDRKCATGVGHGSSLSTEGKLLRVCYAERFMQEFPE